MQPHGFRDDVVLADDGARPNPVRDAADRLAQAFPRDTLASEVAVLDPLVWASDEGLVLARADAHCDIRFTGTPDRDRARVVPASDRAAARNATERRVALASYRVAEEREPALQ